MSLQDFARGEDRKSTRLNSSHTEIYTLSLHDALPISPWFPLTPRNLSGDILPDSSATSPRRNVPAGLRAWRRSEEHTSELQSHRDLHSFPTRRSSDLAMVSANAAKSFWRYSSGFFCNIAAPKCPCRTSRVA